MEHATLKIDSFTEKYRWFKPEHLHCDSCGQRWSSCYDDYAGMQDIDFIICSCGNQVCQLGELKA